MPPVRLNPRGGEVRVGELTLRTPGYAGTAELTRLPEADAPAATLRAETPGDRLLAAVVKDANLIVQHELKLDALERLEQPDAGVVRSAAGAPGVELDVPDVTADWGQMLLATDSGGITTWHFADPQEADVGTLRGTGTRTYRVRAVPQPPATGGPELRGIFGAVGHVLVRVIAFPLKDAVGRVGKRFAGRWERSRRPYRMRSFGPADYTGASAPAPDWQRLGEGPALLFLHGTFSQAHTGFGHLPPETMGELYDRYGGRVFAFDHYTMSDGPQQNVERFAAELPESAKLQLDVVCHSRGGLVARELVRQQVQLSSGSRRLQVGQVVFVAAPNAGTVLADFDHLGDLIDRYTTLLSLFPDNGVTDVLETIITVTKTIAVDALEGLPGLTSMRPGGRYLSGLNEAGAAAGVRFRALTSDYEPTTPALRAWLSDQVVDRLFARAGNDLVVPTAGVYDANGAGGFPIADRHVFGPADGVAHSGYFGNATGAAKLLEWLTG